MKNSKTTVTPTEAASIFRDAGVSISKETLQKGLVEGKFPFGVAIKQTQWVYIIYRKPLMDYLKSIGAELAEGV